jgi:hypothetical protein
MEGRIDFFNLSNGKSGPLPLHLFSVYSIGFALNFIPMLLETRGHVNGGQTLTLDIRQLKLKCEIMSVQSQGLTPLSHDLPPQRGRLHHHLCAARP